MFRISSINGNNVKLEGSGAATCSTKQADVTSDGNSTTKSFTLTCNATQEGTINLSVTGDITSGTGETKDISISKQVTVTPAKSSALHISRCLLKQIRKKIWK